MKEEHAVGCEELGLIWLERSAEDSQRASFTDWERERERERGHVAGIRRFDRWYCSTWKNSDLLCCLTSKVCDHSHTERKLSKVFTSGYSQAQCLQNILSGWVGASVRNQRCVWNNSRVPLRQMHQLWFLTIATCCLSASNQNCICPNSMLFGDFGHDTCIGFLFDEKGADDSREKWYPIQNAARCSWLTIAFSCSCSASSGSRRRSGKKNTLWMRRSAADVDGGVARLIINK